MKKLTSIAVLGTVCGCLSLSSAQAQLVPSLPSATDIQVIYDEPVSSTLISGDAGPDQTIKTPGHDAFLYGIGFGEVHDEPCYLKLYWWRYNQDFSNRRQGDFTTEFDVCDNSTGFADRFLVLDNFSRSNLRAIHAIKIGVNNGNGRLKGAKVYGSYINRDGDGAVERAGDDLWEDFERPNMDDWESKESCDTGEVAVGVIVEYDSDEIIGLGLQCAEPNVWRTVSSATRPE